MFSSSNIIIPLGCYLIILGAYAFLFSDIFITFSKSKVNLFINGSRRCAFYPPPSVSEHSVSQIFKAIATRIRGKSKQTLKSPRIELGTPCLESCALAN